MHLFLYTLSHYIFSIYLTAFECYFGNGHLLTRMPYTTPPCLTVVLSAFLRTCCFLKEDWRWCRCLLLSVSLPIYEIFGGPLFTGVSGVSRHFLTAIYLHKPHFACLWIRPRPLHGRYSMMRLSGSSKASFWDRHDTRHRQSMGIFVSVISPDAVRSRERLSISWWRGELSAHGSASACCFIRPSSLQNGINPIFFHLFPTLSTDFQTYRATPHHDSSPSRMTSRKIE